MSEVQDIKITLPKKMQFLFKPHRYKVAYGGRGGGKSWAFAIALLILGYKGKIRVLCAREVQKTIKDSVHKLLCDMIELMQLHDHYQILNTEIKGRNGTEFSFIGLRHVDKNSMKSFEGANYCWVEEAHSVSKASWEVLIPTIRADGSEIWLSLNPELETDYTYEYFVVNPPPNAKVQKINWYDNPHLPQVLKDELEYKRQTDYDGYLHVWEGHCKQSLEGAVYADEMREATLQNRITQVPYCPEYPVHTFWDLGWRDCTSVWFVQVVPGTGEFRIIDFLQNSFKKPAWYAERLQNRGYVYAQHWMPHDSKHGTLASEGKTVAGLMKGYGFDIQQVPKISLEDGLGYARTIFSRCYFDENKCAEGLQDLRHYKYELDEKTNLFSKTPKHDEHSHAADAFRYFAVSVQEYREPRKRKKVKRGWMG